MSFQRATPDGCLSAFRISEAARHDDPAIAPHLASCARCRELVAVERGEVLAARLEALPPRLSALAEKTRTVKPRWLGWLGGGLGLIAAAAVAFFVTRAPAPVDPDQNGPNGVRTKGALAVEATVVRGEVTVVSDRAITELPTLEDGDRLRLRVRNGAGAMAKVEVADAGSWVAVHEGLVPDDGWLSLGLRAEAGSPTELRVTLCRAPETPCVTSAATLLVAPRR